jgi:hypothetical protein
MLFLKEYYGFVTLNLFHGLTNAESPDNYRKQIQSQYLNVKNGLISLMLNHFFNHRAAVFIYHFYKVDAIGQIL